MAKTMVSWQAFPSLPPRAPLAFLSHLKLPFPSLSNACHAGYGLWGKKSQRDLGEGMLGMLEQCTKDLYAVFTVEALCVLSCVLFITRILIRSNNRLFQNKEQSYSHFIPIARTQAVRVSTS